MKKIQVTIAAFAIVLLVCLGLVLYMFFNRQKIVYVDTIRLFNGYDLKNDLEKEAEVGLMSYKTQIDSAAAAMKAAISQKRDKKELQQMQYEFLVKKREAEELYAKSNSEINEVVWKRLNPLIDQYGQDKDYELIVGANGMGTVLYGSKKKDITDDLIDYINKEYEKGH